jgi:hypothetical protein
MLCLTSQDLFGHRITMGNVIIFKVLSQQEKKMAKLLRLHNANWLKKDLVVGKKIKIKTWSVATIKSTRAFVNVSDENWG